MDGLEVFFPFIPRKPQDIFVKYVDTAMYYEAEKEFKKAQGENADFEDNILKVCSHTYQCIIIIFFPVLYLSSKEADIEMMEKINQLESTLSEIMQSFEKKTDLMLQRQEEMSTKIEELQQQLNYTQ